MASKIHCDVCDAVIEKVQDRANIRIDNKNNIQVPLRIEYTIGDQHRYDGDFVRKELCNGCQRKVFQKVFESFGGRVAESLGPDKIDTTDFQDHL